MTRRDLAILDHELDRVGQSQQAQQVRDRRSILSNRVGYLLLSEAELVEQTLIAARFFDRVEVGALQVLDEGKHEHCLLVEVPHDRLNVGPSKVGRGSETPFPRDELESIAAPTNGDRL